VTTVAFVLWTVGVCAVDHCCVTTGLPALPGWPLSPWLYNTA